ncbi:hypothetical protein [Deinococcus knuensis]|nr:hypothetical protein [Deinococcus knuensis]
MFETPPVPARKKPKAQAAAPTQARAPASPAQTRVNAGRATASHKGAGSKASGNKGTGGNRTAKAAATAPRPGRTPPTPKPAAKLGPQLPRNAAKPAPGAARTAVMRPAPRSATLQRPSLNPNSLKGRPARQTAAATPSAGGVMGFFRQKLTALHDTTRKALPALMSGARKVTADAAAFAANPVRNAASAAARFTSVKVTQFKKWYATPEGKAKFWKGVALTAVGVATVASGGALTAPALALAAGISAAGGVAAQVVENKVFNAAAKAKAQKDRAYKFKERSTLEGVTARSVAIDAVVGSVGGPVFKFAGKALVGTAKAFGQGALPAARGLGHLAAAGAKRTGAAAATVARKYLPQGVQKAAATAAHYVRANARLLRRTVTRHARGAAASLTNLRNAGVKRIKDATAKPRAALTDAQKRAAKFLHDQTPTLRRLATELPRKARRTARNTVRRARVYDRALRDHLKQKVANNSGVKLARRAQKAVNTLGNRLSRNLVKRKVAAADRIDAARASMGGKIAQTSVARQARHLKEHTVKRLDDLIARNPGGHVAKAIVEFRASGTAIRTHLNKVWGEASKDLNKDLSGLLGCHGSVQADFKALAEQGAPTLYAREVAAARALAEKRLRDKVAHDTEATLLAQRGAPGVTISRRVAQQRAQEAADRAIQESAEQLTRQAHTFVARHPSTTLEHLAIKTEALDASKKALEHYFGQNAGRKGALERLGMALSTPVRAPINDRIEKYQKVVEALRSATPLSSTVMLGSEALNEVLSKTAEKAIAEPFKAKASELKGEKKEKKATEEDGNVLLKVVTDTLDELFPSLNPDSIVEDAAKQLNMKDDED